MAVKIKLAWANIKNTPDLPANQVRADVRAIWRWLVGFFGKVHIIGWQEIGELADDRAIMRVFNKARGYRHMFIKKATPITVLTLLWVVVDQYWVRAHNGLEGVSPRRGFSVVLLRRKWHSWCKVAAIDLHFVSKAWSDPNASHKDWRRENWREMFAELQDEIKALRAAGYIVFVFGDWNIRLSDLLEMPWEVPFKVIATNGYYDHGIVSEPADLTFHRLAKDVMREHLWTDHDPVAVKGEVSQR